jgi:hypothetical protein
MRFRLKAFGLHLLGSSCALTLVLGGLYLGWYRWPGWYLTSVLRVLIIVGIVDLALGPTLTLIIANPKKPRRELARDIAIIIAVQLVALAYGARTLWHGRPLYYTFSADRLELVQASDLHAEDIALARQLRPDLAPHWYSRPRWVWAPLPEDPQEATKIVQSVVLNGGRDVIDMPRYFRAWDEGLPLLRQALVAVADIRVFTKDRKQSLKRRIASLGLDPDQRNVLVIWGAGVQAVAVFDPQTLRLHTVLKP